MPKLIWLDHERVREQVIPKRGFVSLGRDADNTVTLPDHQVSRHHAQLVCGPHGCLLKDMKSANGVKVNGDLVYSRFLRDGDVIRIGRHILEYYAGERVRNGSALGSPILSGGGGVSASEPLKAQSRAFLRFIDGPHTGKIQTVDRPLLPIGNPEHCYAAISHRSNGYYLLNLGKQANARLNAHPISGAGALLKNGDIIQLDEERIEVRIFSQRPH